MAHFSNWFVGGRGGIARRGGGGASEPPTKLLPVACLELFRWAWFRGRRDGIAGGGRGGGCGGAPEPPGADRELGVHWVPRFSVRMLFCAVFFYMPVLTGCPMGGVVLTLTGLRKRYIVYPTHGLQYAARGMQQMHLFA